MSDTPRTDANVQTIWSNDPHCLGPVETVSASFARQLERELAACPTEADQRDVSRYRWLRSIRYGVHGAPQPPKDDERGNWWNWVLGNAWGDSFDTIIDAAMKQSEAEERPQFNEFGMAWKPDPE